MTQGDFSPAVIPSGVSDYDAITGGMPVGSVILLSGEAGAGHIEFALTSAARLMKSFDHGRGARFSMGGSRSPVALPGRISYVSFTRSKEQLIREVRATFPKEYGNALSDHLDFADLSSVYFADSVVPPEWSQTTRSLLDGDPNPGTNGPLHAMASALEQRGQGALVVVDSLSDLLVRRSVVVEDLLTLLKGLRRRAKTWNGLVYLLLARNVVDSHIEQALMDSVDGVLGFTWTHSPSRSTRSRAMIIEKFMSILSHVPTPLQGRFVLRVNPLDGLVTTQYERI